MSSPSSAITDEPEPDGMTFGEAMNEVLNGARVTKLEWNDPETYVYLSGDILKLHKADGKDYNLIVSAGDLRGTDWVGLVYMAASLPMSMKSREP